MKTQAVASSKNLEDLKKLDIFEFATTFLGWTPKPEGDSYGKWRAMWQNGVNTVNCSKKTNPSGNYTFFSYTLSLSVEGV